MTCFAGFPVALNTVNLSQEKRLDSRYRDTPSIHHTRPLSVCRTEVGGAVDLTDEQCLLLWTSLATETKLKKK